jgi:hypothetical protein
LEEIRPVAAMDAFVVRQSWSAGLLFWDTEGALDVAGRALRTVRVDTELVLAAGCGYRGH